MTGSSTVIEFIDVSVQKAKRVLLDRIQLKVFQNESLAIIGPNGAGKTTLLKVIVGFEKFEGTLKLFGTRVTHKRSRPMRLRIAYVPQFFQIDPAFPISSIEAVITGAVGRMGLFRSPTKELKEKALRLLEMMRVGHLSNTPLGHLSGGERQKVSLARALLQEPDLLLMDEPTANLDIAVQREVLNLVDEIHRREALTILFVTHDFNMIPASVNRAVMLDRGRLVFDGDIHKAFSGETLSGLFQYPLETFERNGKRFISYG